jgi:hypothetical protein
MSFLKNRIEKLKNGTSDVAVRETLENLLELAGNVSEQKLSTLVHEKLSEIKSSDIHVKRFIDTEKNLNKLNDMGISRALDRIKYTGVWDHNPRIQYVTEWYQKSKFMDTPDFLLSEQFVAQLNPFCFDPSINEAVKVVREAQEKLAEEIAVATTINLLENSKSAKFYRPLINNLREFIENKSTDLRSAVIAEMEIYSYEPTIRDLQNKLKKFESEETGSKFNISRASTECHVNPVFSFVLVEKNSDYFSIDNHYFKKVHEEVTSIDVSSMQRINENFVRLNSILNSKNVTVDKNTISYEYGNNVLKINIADKSINYNGNRLNIKEVNNRLVESGIFRWNQQDDLNNFNAIYENLDTLCEIDFAKTIVAKNHPSIKASIMRLGGSVTIVKNNPFMNEHKVYSSMNGTQARNFILEFLNYDISESLTDFLSSENRRIQQLENERRAILNKIDECENNINKIEEAQQDILISSSEEISLVKRELHNEIHKLKNQYAEKTALLKKLKTYEYESFEEQDDIDMMDTDNPDDMEVEFLEEVDFGVGDLVTYAGKEGRIVSVDSVQKKATVSLEDGTLQRLDFTELETNPKVKAVTEAKKTKGKGGSTFVQETPERVFNIGDNVDVAEKGVGRITGIDSTQKTATVIFTDGTQSKYRFPELRLASKEEVEDEEEYSEEMEKLKDYKKKGSTTYVQELPQRDFQVGDVVSVTGKGLGRVTAIDSIRHIAIVMLQNGQQTEEEFSNLKSRKEDIENASADNYGKSIEMGGEPNMSDQPFESSMSGIIDDLDIVDDYDSYENSDFSRSDIEMEDAEIEKKWSSVPNSFKKYLDDTFVKDPYKYSPEGEDDEEWEPEYEPLSNKPSKFMDSELDSEEELELEKFEESEDTGVSYTFYNSSNVQKSSDFDLGDNEMYAVVSPDFEGDLANATVVVFQDDFERASLDEAIQVEVDGEFAFVPKYALILI